MLLFILPTLGRLRQETGVLRVLQVSLPQCPAQSVVEYLIQPSTIRAVFHRVRGDERLEVDERRVFFAYLAEACTIVAQHHAVVFLAPLARLNHHRVALREVPNQLVALHRQPHALCVALE